MIKKGIIIPQEDVCSLYNLINSITGKLVFLAVSGSRAYNTQTKGSDWDFRGVYIQPTEEILMNVPTPDGGYNYVPQVNDDTNDITYYEIGRFLELLEKGNPNILELLNIPDECILIEDEVFTSIISKRKQFITKQLFHTFSGYAATQVGKAKGMNKKIHNPQPKKRKDILEFCYVIDGNDTIPFWRWYEVQYGMIGKEAELDLNISNWGLVKLNHGDQLYAFYNVEKEDGWGLRGMVKSLDNTEFRLSSIPKKLAEEIEPIVITFNLDGFKKHCKDHKEYWEWVEKRNPDRFKDNMKGEIGYDHKNMMHCLRLIGMAEDLVRKNEIVVRRPNRDFLLSIRNGEHTYESLMSLVEEKIAEIKVWFEESDLEDKVDRKFTRELLKTIRKQY